MRTSEKTLQTKVLRLTPNFPLICVVTDITPSESEGCSVMACCALETVIFADFVTTTDCVTGCDIRRKKIVGVCESMFSQERGFSVVHEASTKFNISKMLVGERQGDC